MPDFSVNIDGDIVPLIKSIEALKGELKTLKDSISTATNPTVVTKLRGEIAATEEAIRKAKAAGPIVAEGSIDEARLNVKRLKAEIASLSDSQLASSEGLFLTKELKAARSELVNLEKQANLTSRVTGNSFTDAIAPVKGLSNQVRQFGRILPGLGIAGLFGLASTGIELLITALSNLNNAEGKAQEQLAAFKKEFKDADVLAGEAAGGEAGNIAKVNALAEVVKNANAPYAERKRALQELKEVNKNYFGDLTLEDSLTSKLTDTVSEYNKALINSAIQKEFIGEIAKLAKAASDNDSELQKARDKLTSSTKATADAENKLNEAANKRIVNESQSTKLINLTDALANAKAKEKEASDNVNNTGLQSTLLLEQQAVLTDRLNKAVVEGLQYKDLDAKAEKKDEDALKKRLDALEKLKTEIEKNKGVRLTSPDASTLTQTQESIFEVQVKIAVRDQKKNHISDAELKKVILGYQEDLNKAFANEAISLEAGPKVKFSPLALAKFPKDISDVVAKATGHEKITITLHDVRVQLFQSKQAKFLDDKDAIQKQLGTEINGLFEGLKLDALTNLGETIGNALIGNGDALKNGLKQMMNILGGVMIQFGKFVITAALKIEALKKIIQNFAIKNPAIAIVGGIALIAAGTALKNANVDVPKFAQGGIATGPTLGIFGEAGTEAIIPLAKLPSLVGKMQGQAVNVSVGMGIKDRELIAFIEKGQKKANRLK